MISLDWKGILTAYLWKLPEYAVAFVGGMLYMRHCYLSVIGQMQDTIQRQQRALDRVIGRKGGGQDCRCN